MLKIRKMKLKNILLSFGLCIVSLSTIQAQKTQVIAHRGFWKTKGAAQNSIASLVKADSIHCYGSEFDVWLTADDHLVVNHDGTFKGVKMETSTEKECTAIILKNGENLPSFKEYAKKAKRLKTHLILELKAHSTPEKETKAVGKILKKVKDAGLAARTEYISFSLHAVKEFIRLAPKGTPVYYLEGDLSPQELKKMGCAGPDYHINIYKKHPEWISECHMLGMRVNVWTVDSPSDMKWLISQKVDFITTNEPTLLQSILKGDSN
jgi:glycerophosphoryl diester phosphodiesterase